MNININSPDFTITEALDDFIHKSASRSLEPVKDNLHQVHVHLRDINGPRGGRDKECTVEISMHGMSPVLVKKRSSDAYSAIRKSFGRAARTSLRHIKRAHFKDRYSKTQTTQP